MRCEIWDKNSFVSNLTSHISYLFQMAKKEIELIDRDLSWLSFNARVLQEAEDKSVPLLERIKFLGIFSNNRDEFFRVRVATIRRMALFGKKGKELLGSDPDKLLEKIQKVVMRQQKNL